MNGAKGFRRYLSTAVALIFTITSMTITAFASTGEKEITVTYKDSKVTFNGKPVSMKDGDGNKLQPFVYDDLDYAPIQAVSKALGLTTAYNSEEGTVTIVSTTSSAVKPTHSTSPGALGTLPRNSTQSGIVMKPQNGSSITNGGKRDGIEPGGMQQNGMGQGGMQQNRMQQNDMGQDGTPPGGDLSENGTPGGIGMLPEGITPGGIGLPPDRTTAGSVTISAIQKTLTVTFNDIEITLNGKEITFEDDSGNTLEPFICNDYVYLPLSALAEALNITMTYDSKTNTIKLTGSNYRGNEGGSGGQKSPGGAGNPGGTTGSAIQSGKSSTSGTAVYLQTGDTVTKSDQTITATKTNQSAVKVVSNGTLTLTDSLISTSGNTTSMDDSSFYGLNAAVLAESGSKVTISDTTIKTTGKGANGVFATGSGTTINLDNVDINCTGSGGHGVDATLGGVLKLTDVDITTSGNGASAAIATDRGSGTITVSGGAVITTGTKSPAIYSTGIISATGTTMKTTASQAVVIEGKNNVTLTDCIMTVLKGSGIFIYQSFSGDAEVGTGNFTMTGGSLTVSEGPMFHSTNTNAVISLKNATLSAASGILLKAGADQWGKTGSNGANVTLTADTQTLEGSVVLDKISTAVLTLKNSSILKSTVNADNSAKSVSIALDSTSKWTVTGNSYITGLTDSDTTLSNIDDNGYTIYYNKDNSANSWLGGETKTLTDGGKLVPN